MPSSLPTKTPTPGVVNKIKENLIDRFKKNLGKVKRVAGGTIKNMMGAGARWDKIQSDKNENYLSSLKNNNKNK